MTLAMQDAKIKPEQITYILHLLFLAHLEQHPNRILHLKLDNESLVALILSQLL